MHNRIKELPSTLQYGIVSYLDFKTRCCLRGVSVGARQLAFAKSEDYTVTLYTYILISASFRNRYPKTRIPDKHSFLSCQRAFFLAGMTEMSAYPEFA